MILVTGGTGLAGSHLLLELVRCSGNVRALKRKSSDTGKVRKIFSYYTPDADKLFEKIEWIDGDLLDVGSLEDAMEGIDEIYHSAAMVSFSPGDHHTMLRVNIAGTADLVNLAIEKAVKKFCFVSSVSTLGRNDTEGIVDEETYWKTSRRNSYYSISKYGAEREVWRGIEEGLNAVIVNPSVILGPGFWNGNSSLFRMVWDGLKFHTSGINGYVDVNDVAKIMVRLMNDGIFGQRFILSSENITYRQFFSMVSKHLGKPEPSINVSPWMSHVAWRAEAFRGMIRGRKPEITREIATTAVQKYNFSSEKIKKALDYRFTPVEDSIKEICGLFLKDISANQI
jgi:dihydroflavonol-4-reductase